MLPLVRNTLFFLSDTLIIPKIPSLPVMHYEA